MLCVFLGDYVKKFCVPKFVASCFSWQSTFPCTVNAWTLYCIGQIHFHKKTNLARTIEGPAVGVVTNLDTQNKIITASK